MFYEQTLNYLIRLYDVKVIKKDEDNITIETEMLYLQFVMTELYTCGWPNFHLRIVDSKHIEIKTDL